MGGRCCSFIEPGWCVKRIKAPQNEAVGFAARNEKLFLLCGDA